MSFLSTTNIKRLLFTHALCFYACTLLGKEMQWEVEERYKVLPKQIAAQYLPSFPAEKKEKKTPEELKKERKKENYKAEFPHLSPKNLSEILLLNICADNMAFRAFLDKRAAGTVCMFPEAWEHIKLFSGSTSNTGRHLLSEYVRKDAPEIEKNRDGTTVRFSYY